MKRIMQIGKTMTAVVYDFRQKYDTGEIDGSPESSIGVLQKHYGKRLEIMKPETILKKVIYLQRCLTDKVDVDEQECLNAVTGYIWN